MLDPSVQTKPANISAASKNEQGKKLLSKAEKKKEDLKGPIVVGLGKSIAYKNGKIVLPKSSTSLLRGKIDIGGAHIISTLAKHQGNYADPTKKRKEKIIFRKNGKTIQTRGSSAERFLNEGRRQMEKPKKLIKFSHEDKKYTAKKTIGSKGKEIYRLFKPRGSEGASSSNKSSCQPWTSTNSSFDINQPPTWKEISHFDASENSDSEDLLADSEVQPYETSSEDVVIVMPHSQLPSQPTTSTKSSFNINQPSTSKEVSEEKGEMSNSNTPEDSESEDSFEESEVQLYESSSEDVKMYHSPLSSQESPFEMKRRNLENILAISEVELKCPICLIIFIDPVILKCGHSFCNFCIQQWRNTSSDCPECRGRMTLQPIKQIALNNMIKSLHSKEMDPSKIACRNALVENRNRLAEEANRREDANEQQNHQQQQNRNWQIMIQAEQAPQHQQQVDELMHYRQWEMLAVQHIEEGPIEEVWEPYQE